MLNYNREIYTVKMKNGEEFYITADKYKTFKEVIFNPKKGWAPEFIELDTKTIVRLDYIAYIKEDA